MSFNFSPKIITDGLILYLDAANIKSYVSSDTTWNDLTVNNNNGTLINGPTYSTTNGGSIVFDGVNDFVQIPDSTSLRPSNITVNVWFRCVNTFGGSTTLSNIIGKSDSSASRNGWNLLSNTTSIFVNVKDNVVNYNFGNLNVDTTKWTNFTLSYNSNSQAFAYYNGSQYSSISIPTINISTQTMRMGISPDPFWARFNGNISSVQIYNRSLSSTEILQNYNAIKSRYLT